MLVETTKINKQEMTVVSSLDIAETFEKRHDHVIRDIRELECSEEFRLSNFGESSYINAQNKKQPMYYVSGLVACGWGYDKVKTFISETNVKKLAV